MLLWQMFPVFLLWIHIKGTPLQKPDLVSSWYELSVEKGGLNSVNITHGLGELPVYVQVQVKSTSEPNKDFIFPGVGISLRDDDERQPRSGMIYLYNEENIIVSAPTSNNRKPGSAIHTENSTNWEGPNSQDSSSALVRVRLWKGSSFPKPDFHSSGEPIGTQCDTNDNVCFYEKLHNFDEYPSFVIVRTQLLNEDSKYGGYMSDGVGASHAVYRRDFTTNGYVIYGFNTSAIRVWTDSSELGALFDGHDGTEFNHRIRDFLSGELEIMAWRSTTLQQDFENIIKMGVINGTIFEMETAYSLDTGTDTDSIVGVVWVEAQDGDNNGFRFPGTGAMAFTLYNDVDPCSYGGLTYGFTNTTLRLWKPRSSGDGKLICIANIFAAGKYSQASNNGKAVMKIWTVSSLDTSCSTDSDCKDQFTECNDSICRCQSGYFHSLSQCLKECIDGRYGATCNGTCGQCYNSAACDKTNGNCRNGCSAGFQGSTCKEECEDGTFGLGCEEKCGNCFNGVPCIKIDGRCATCAAGYEGESCLNKCQTGTFGFNCIQHCGMCFDENVCDIYTGECPNGCTDKYKGIQCLQEINQDTSSSSEKYISLPVFIGSLFAVVVIVLGLVWLCYRMRLNKKARKAENNEDTQSNYDTLTFNNSNGEITHPELNRSA